MNRICGVYISDFTCYQPCLKIDPFRHCISNLLFLLSLGSSLERNSLDNGPTPFATCDGALMKVSLKQSWC